MQHKVLTESFDEPYVSVATVFRNTGTLVQMAQAVGRAVRRIGIAQAGELGAVPCLPRMLAAWAASRSQAGR